MKEIADKLNKIYHLDSTIFVNYVNRDIRKTVYKIAIEHRRQLGRKRSMVQCIEEEIKGT